jgi:hypothetical protein
MKIMHKGIRVSCREGKAFQVTTPGGATFRVMANCESDYWLIGIDVDKTGIIKVGQGGTMRIGHAMIGSSSTYRAT